ncbi:MAG: hypothetical protein WBA88_22800 [Pseudaminobacter sp.]
MTNVFEAAANFRKVWINLGKAAGEISLSTNRFGQKSAYFDVAGHGRFRVSDHSCNADFRINERTIDAARATKEEAENIIAIDAAAVIDADKVRAAQIAERDVYETPFKARFLAAKEHERTDIIIDAYKGTAHDKAARREIARRWMA